MANKFVSFLEAVGADFKKGFEAAFPYVEKATQIAAAAELPISSLDPAVGVVFSAVVNECLNVEQKFAAMGQQTGSGPQKLQTVAQILGPVITQVFQATGRPTDAVTVNAYISAVVAFLNAVPALNSAPAPAPAPAAPPATPPAGGG